MLEGVTDDSKHLQQPHMFFVTVRL